jgi:hybrid cluster-associated redox disulfide protein
LRQRNSQIQKPCYFKDQTSTCGKNYRYAHYHYGINKKSEKNDTIVHRRIIQSKRQRLEAMKKNGLIPSSITVKELLDRYPQTLRIFMDMGVLCVGCPAEAFHSLADVARAYKLNLNQLRERILSVIGEQALSVAMDSKENTEGEER